MKVRHILLTIVLSFLAAFVAVKIGQKDSGSVSKSKNSEVSHPTKVLPTKTVLYESLSSIPSGQPIDFKYAAQKATPAVVHIKTISKPQQTMASPHFNPFRDFFGDEFFRHFYGEPKPRQQTASGSGVIFSFDGYIVTNNHVVQEAHEIEVTLHDGRSFKGKLIGADPSTDIAVLKIEEPDLPWLTFGNSDSVQVGEWVVAVGNPFNLSSTVTAGIVSAKARNINILKENSAIESFIQTDAAVNPGNSGGALVNIRGELIGINTAIATPTGAYAGYSFAVPANLVKKVVEDLREYGLVQRGYLGVSIRNIDSELMKEKKLASTRGVYIAEVMKGSASEDAGLKSGDIITHINNMEVNTSPQLQEQVARFKPGDKIRVDYLRNGASKSTDIVLKNKNLTTDLVSKDKGVLQEKLGVELAELDKEQLKELGIPGGVRVKRIFPGGAIKKYTDMREGFVITKIDSRQVKSPAEVLDILEKKSGGVLVEGVYPDYSGTYYYAFGL